MPAATLLAAARFNVAVFPVMLVGLAAIVRPLGAPEMVSVTAPA